MKALLAAATALTMGGAAFAYQTTGSTTATDMDVQPSASATMTMHTTLDPTVALTPPASWNEQQRALWQQHVAFHPPAWTPEQRAAWQQQLATPPSQWTEAQRMAWQQHRATLPANWTAEQRAMYEQHMAMWQTPWVAHAQHNAALHGANADFSTFAGMGGPYEEVYGSGTVSLQPRPATENYPPCSPGPGDDNCIQLYERGVRANLASWNRNTGGLVDGAATTAMGGPYEPVTSGTAANGTVDANVHTGMGGPVESATGYPPCQPGPGDDRCIQLYERGVTGRNN